VSGLLTIVRPGLPVPPSSAADLTLSFDQFRRWMTTGRVLAHIGRHRDGRVLVHRLETSGRPLPLALALRAMCRGDIFIEDARGRRLPLTARRLAGWSAQLAGEPFRVASLLREIEREVADLERPVSRHGRVSVNLAHPPLYLRTDLSFGVRAGGSVGHIAGVLNTLDAFTGPPIFVTTDDVPTVRHDIETHQVTPSDAFWNFKELPTFVLNRTFESTAARVVRGRPIAFVYQRYSLNNYAGLQIARTHRVPLVLEYNGSEIWMSRHWGHPIKYEALSERIERLNLAAADVIVVVSRPMAEEIAGRGVNLDKILVNFNGVDERRYGPDVDGRGIRARLGLEGKTVVGFIGTFGPWHGADVLARAFLSMLARDPSRVATTRLLMIGDGVGLPAVRQLVTDSQAAGAVVFTGLVPQEEGPAYLSASDVLVSPHVPNPDRTPFFGSPTKVFEYMAMGKGIVASDLDQIGEVLRHERDAWLVRPADPEALADGMRRLIDDRELRGRLGAEARRQVVAHHTWRQHTRRTIERLRDIAA
jgi:glycosyltransferase involved in cell wall biosynthesis